MSVFPCLQDLGLGQIFYGVLEFVEEYLNGAHAAADGPLPDDFAIDQDWATARKAYARRAARFIHSGTTAPRLLFALGTLSPLMHGHASLFKLHDRMLQLCDSSKYACCVACICLCTRTSRT